MNVDGSTDQQHAADQQRGLGLRPTEVETLEAFPDPHGLSPNLLMTVYHNDVCGLRVGAAAQKPISVAGGHFAPCLGPVLRVKLPYTSFVEHVIWAPNTRSGEEIG